MTPSKRAINAMLDILAPHVSGRNLVLNEGIEYLKLLAAQERSTICFIRDECDSAAWWFGVPGTLQRWTTPRRGLALLAYYTAMRDGEADAQLVRNCTQAGRSVRNSRLRLVRWLERIGQHALAAEICKVVVGESGRMTYTPTSNSPRIVFE